MSTVLKGKDSGPFLNSSFASDMANYPLDKNPDKNRKAHPKDKKTDWFYKNEQYDRKLDERADKNNYRTM